MTATRRVFTIWRPECGFEAYERLAVAIVRGENNLLFRQCDIDSAFSPGQIILWGGAPNKLIHSPQETIRRKLEKKLGVANISLSYVDHFQKLEKRHGVEGNIFVYDVVLPNAQIDVREGTLFSVSESVIRQCVLADDLSVEAPFFSELPEYKNFSLLTREILKFFYSGKT